MTDLKHISSLIQERYADFVLTSAIAHEELTLEVSREHLRSLCVVLRDDVDLKFEELMDICGVDYLQYGISEWTTTSATSSGFERAVSKEGHTVLTWNKPRFAVVYHLLSITHNHRLRLRVFVDNDPLCVDSVTDIWSSANWNERETYDLFGIIFQNHPDLRRILTDYGFSGHPFRKDFPLIGDVEMRYDAQQGRVIYEPVSIEPRTLVPRVIRNEHPADKEENV
ncbi:MAG: NADH-quinone oxidoreductase subunit C [Gammaproteobacteria bacterium]|nr:NADH-quinone oxidoreductase subunit C [Gammaproteobacteria bacterium]